MGVHGEEGLQSAAVGQGQIEQDHVEAVLAERSIAAESNST